MSFLIRKGRKEDCQAVLELIKELAIFERAEKEMVLSLEELQEDGFGKHPIYEMFVAELHDKVLGVALYYEKYSTWKGRCIYLEDLIVTEKHRGIGAGKALFEAVIQEAKQRNSGRMEWQVLDWNQSAIDFYKKYEAELDGEWINGKFRREQLQKFS
ncbi:MAG: GNAT family N-acetyltransferase [Bacteroidetes bacterium]|nr:MAG: GNAT family N-acetyltransferase [Bacteroidota bacterium]MBL1143891.1 GNAT family N-acetyltransferase [Bacteroidota bacterium]MCB0802957.1 GNAT family N-acetyltransferase [Flavobacteriales bacterium]NOG56692.1 GNAT family N-acetyltransferase [Bacteroidota bacterium]